MGVQAGITHTRKLHIRKIASSSVWHAGVSRQPKCTDEGILIHEASPYRDSCHLVWGSILWDSGLALAKFFVWCEENEVVGVPPLRSKSVLELGAGTGVVGLTLGKLGASVTVTDNEPEGLELLRVNADANSLGSALDIRELSWAIPSTYLRSRTFDIVVAADVLYSRRDGMFMRALAAHVRTGSGTIAFLASPPRTDSPLDGFFSMALEFGFLLERLEDSNGRPAGCVQGPAALAFEGCRFVPLRTLGSSARAAKEGDERVQI